MFCASPRGYITSFEISDYPVGAGLIDHELISAIAASGHPAEVRDQNPDSSSPPHQTRHTAICHYLRLLDPTLNTISGDIHQTDGLNFLGKTW